MRARTLGGCIAVLMVGLLLGCSGTAAPPATVPPAKGSTPAESAQRTVASTTAAQDTTTRSGTANMQVPSTAVSSPAQASSAAPATVPPSKPANPELILATTTSTQDSGLLDVIIPVFHKQTGYSVKTIAVGSGQAMTMGERGEADVLLVHAADSERTFMAAGHGIDRQLVMHNDFIIIGPAADPAKIKGEQSAVAAMQKLANVQAPFISRGDNSGTDQLEQKIWRLANITPKGQPWYQQTGQGMGATLNVAAEKGGYTISDRATYLAAQNNLNLQILVQGDKSLLNVYHVIQVNPNKSPKINALGAKAFADFMVAKDTQDVIAKFGVDKYGQALFYPDAGKKDEEVGG